MGRAHSEDGRYRAVRACFAGQHAPWDSTLRGTRCPARVCAPQRRRPGRYFFLPDCCPVLPWPEAGLAVGRALEAVVERVEELLGIWLSADGDEALDEAPDWLPKRWAQLSGALETGGVDGTGRGAVGMEASGVDGRGPDSELPDAGGVCAELLELRRVEGNGLDAD